MALADNTRPDPDRKFVRHAMQTALLDPDHERDLATRWREDDDEEALHELTSAYVRLVISMAGKFRNYGLPMSDLIQEGNIGLMQAAARFEPSRDVRFSTYASWWIRSSIQDFVLRNWSIVRTGTTAAQKSLFFNLKRLRAKINDLDGDTLSEESRDWIAQQLGVPARDVEKMAARLSASDKSLNAPVAEDGQSQFQDLMPDELNPTPEQSVMEERDGAQRRRWIAEAMSRLSPREQTIIRARKLRDESVTLESLGEQLSISKERVRQIEHAALAKLRDSLIKIAGDPETSGILPTV
ncbi:MAG: RNA polymerase factor sigma-32 [Ponticaulis sp.]|nr:RNA polymerase factor sigma-32 [Ponticaulis sp.]